MVEIFPDGSLSKHHPITNPPRLLSLTRYLLSRGSVVGKGWFVPLLVSPRWFQKIAVMVKRSNALCYIQPTKEEGNIDYTQRPAVFGLILLVSLRGRLRRCTLGEGDYTDVWLLCSDKA